MKVTIDIAEAEIATLKRTLRRYQYLQRRERTKGEPDFEIFDLEGAFGNYQWLVEAVVAGRRWS